MALAGRVLSQNQHDDGALKKAEIYDTDRVHSSGADCTLQAEKYDEFKSRNICLGDDFIFICFLLKITSYVINFKSTRKVQSIQVSSIEKTTFVRANFPSNQYIGQTDRTKPPNWRRGKVVEMCRIQ